MDNDNDKQSKSSMPLVSRLDRLDSIMKDLEGKQSISRWSSDDSFGNGIVKTPCMPLDLALREAHSKGSLLDRINTLENRLFQLCREMEPSRKLSTWMVQKSRDISLSHKCSSPIFSNSNHGCKQVPKVHANKFEFQAKTRKEQERLKQLRALKEQIGKNGPNREEKPCKTGKKRVSNWPHLKILGC